MANFRDQWSEASGSTSSEAMAADFSWIHGLARGEQNPEADRLLQAASGGGVDPQQRIEEAAVDFLTRLREQFTEYCRLFNGYSEAGSRFQEIKVYSVAQTAADFMIYRNQIKLIAQNVAHGVIQLAFAQHQRNTLAIEGQSLSAAGQASAGQKGHEFLAQVGPFGDVSWTYQGEKVYPAQIARFYFTEFVRATRDYKKNRPGSQQLLLEQIKALLQEQGLQI